MRVGWDYWKLFWYRPTLQKKKKFNNIQLSLLFSKLEEWKMMIKKSAINSSIDYLGGGSGGFYCKINTIFNDIAGTGRRRFPG